jgi:hypothetical protein
MADPKESTLPHTTPPTPVSKDVVEPSAPKAILDDEPSPEVEAVFLRPKNADAARLATPAVATPAQAPLDESLIDSITRIVTEMLQVHVRESVTAAVRALAPRLVVALPADEGQGAAPTQLRARPSRFQKHR